MQASDVRRVAVIGAAHSYSWTPKSVAALRERIGRALVDPARPD